MSGGARFRLRSRVEFSDTDVTQVVYYGRYFAYFDRAIFAYRRELGLDPLGPSGHRYLIRASSAEYRNSLRFDDEYEIATRVARIGRSSHTFALQVERLDASGPVVAAVGEVTVVGVDEYGGTASPIPADLRAAIESYEAEVDRSSAE